LLPKSKIMNVYKLLRITLALSVLIITGSCGDDDDASIDSEIVGTWTFTNDSYSECTDSEDNIEIEQVCDADNCSKIRFESDGTLSGIETIDGETETSTGTFSTNGDEVTLTVVIDNVTFSVVLTYSISGEVLLLNYGTDEFDGCLNIETYTKD